MLGLAATGGLAPGATAQTTVSVETNRQLFAVMCALHAAGYQSNISSATFHPVRARLRGTLLRKEGPATDALRAFYHDHLLADNASTLSRYVSFAQVIGPPPSFKFAVSRDELPPDVLALEGFNEVLANFDREAQIEELWKSVQPEYAREIRRIQVPVGQIVMVSASYLREVSRMQPERSFSIFVEPMIGGKTSLRNVGGRYAIMLNPAAELPLEEIRHAYLHYLLDPLPYRYRAATNSRRIFLQYAARAPRLPSEFRDDFPAFLTECLVKAVELRLTRMSPAKLAKEIDAAEGDGFVLMRALYRALETGFDKSEPAMSLYYPDLLRLISIGDEGQRLEKIQFPAAETPAISAAEVTAETEETELERWLTEGERQIAAHDAPGAAETFDRVLKKYPEHPRALYGLAVASTLGGDAQRAKSIFQSLVSGPRSGQAAPVEKSPPYVLAWSHVYLGRLYDLEGNRELALTEYRATLSVEGAPEKALMAARSGMDKQFRAPATQPGVQPDKP